MFSTTEKSSVLAMDIVRYRSCEQNIMKCIDTADNHSFSLLKVVLAEVKWEFEYVISSKEMGEIGNRK